MVGGRYGLSSKEFNDAMVKAVIDNVRAMLRPSRYGGSGPRNTGITPHIVTLGLALAKGARYFLASTSEVYGDPLVHPQPED